MDPLKSKQLYQDSHTVLVYRLVNISEFKKVLNLFEGGQIASTSKIQITRPEKIPGYKERKTHL